MAVLSTAIFSVDASAQLFKEEAFNQQYNDDPASDQDTTDVLFSFKEYFGGLSHKREIRIGTMTAGSALFIGGSQIYNRQAWKLPIVYSAIGGSLGAGIALNAKGNKEAAKYCFIGAGVAYWATLMDGVINFKPSEYPHPGKATLYSLLVPGLGQIYNREYWKLPIYLGAIGFAVHLYADNRANYLRFRDIYIQASDKSYSGPISAQQALYYRDIYRRYRDYSVLAIAALYVLQVIDANVFSYMHNFEVDDDIALKVAPAVIIPDNQFASITPTSQPAAFGLRLGLNF
ncbi:hypothetical protein SAMN06298214_0853 [Bacteroidales bacterium WCE2004]|nr:hypothetical protein SAMN06298214_0853 [Bacteroidales bacterium WCE2004]